MRTLLIRPGAIGDCIRSFPELESLRSRYTEVWTSRPTVPLVLFADRVRALADTGIDLAGLPNMPLPPDFQRFDVIHSWYGTQRDDFRNAVAQFPFRFHNAIPSGPPPGVPRIAISGPRHESIVLHPFSGSARKNWPLSNFRELARLLGEVKWTCGPEEEFDGAVRFENLAELAKWISGARLYIGNDSGITHLAAAVGTPTLALFGPTDPAIWCPAGEHVRWSPFRSPKEVAELAEDMLRLL